MITLNQIENIKPDKDFGYWACTNISKKEKLEKTTGIPIVKIKFSFPYFLGKKWKMIKAITYEEFFQDRKSKVLEFPADGWILTNKGMFFQQEYNNTPQTISRHPEKLKNLFNKFAKSLEETTINVDLESLFRLGNPDYNLKMISEDKFLNIDFKNRIVYYSP